MHEKKLKHLEFIQAAVSRMASNLFLLKGWTVTLIAALFALAAKDAKPVYFLLAYLAAFTFWILDGYFLAMEQRFRELYDVVRFKDEKDIDFDMNPNQFANKRPWRKAALSSTLVIYYGFLILTMFIVILVISHGGAN